MRGILSLVVLSAACTQGETMPAKHILIIDDQPTVLSVLAAGLRNLGEGYVIETAVNGRDAIKKVQTLKNVQQKDYELVITDYKMPDMNGVEVAQTIKRLSPSTRIILMSSYDMAGVEATSKQLNFEGLLNKPVSIAQIRDIVAKALERTTSSSQEKILTAPTSNSSSNSPLYGPLEMLRINTNARCVLLLSASGHMVELAGNGKDLEISSVSALVAANFMAASELAKLLGNDSVFKSSYHEGLNYDIYAHDVDGKFLIAVIFGPESKAGLVRFYVNKTIEELPTLLTEDLFAVDFSDSDISESIQDELDELFSL